MEPIRAMSSVPAAPAIGQAMPGLEAAQALRGAKMDDAAKLRLAAQEFESILTRTMISQMRKTVSEGGLLPKSSGQKMFEEMMDDQLAVQLSGQMGLGLTDAIVRQLSPWTNPSAAETDDLSGIA